MLQSIKNLFGYTVAARDGNVGRANDLLFDDRSWTTRYLVLDTGKWLPGKKVLIVPGALRQPIYQGRLFPVDLTSDVIESAPALDADLPVSKQYEVELNKYYSTTGFGAGVPALYDSGNEVEEGDSHLRSAREVMGYHIAAIDGDIGHVEDLIVEDEPWEIRYAVVDTRNWLPGKKVLVATDWLDSIEWGSRHVRVDLTKARIENSPPFDPATPVNREYEERLYDFYGRPAYWVGTR